MTLGKKIFVLFVFCSVHLVCKGDNTTSIEEVVDMAKIKGDSYTKFILRGIWPKQEVFAVKKCDKQLIGSDIATLSNTLTRVLVDECLPTSQEMDSVIGVPEYGKDEDCLFLCYMTKSGIRIEVQDGEGLFILLASSKWKARSLVDIQEFVKAYAITVIKYPQVGGVEENPIVFVSSLDIGKSKCGTITWKHKGENDLPSTDFYSRMMWWSDGTRVLFAMSNMPKDEYAKLGTIANRARHWNPHKFHYRNRDVQPTVPTNITPPSEVSVLDDALAKQDACMLNLRLIDALKEQWRLEKGKKSGDQVVTSEIDAYYRKKMPPVCPEGGTYTYNAVGVRPECSFIRTNSVGTILRHKLSR